MSVPLSFQTQPLGVGSELQLTDAIKLMVKNTDVYAYAFKGKRYDAGDKVGYIKAILDFALERADLRDEIGRYLRTIETGGGAR